MLSKWLINFNYLEVNINISDSSIVTNIYNKVDDFDFPVVMFTFPESNMPCETGYNVFYSQILRYSIIISHVNSFVTAVNKLYRILSSRGYKHWELVKKFRLFLRKNPEILFKYHNLNKIVVHIDSGNIHMLE